MPAQIHLPPHLFLIALCLLAGATACDESTSEGKVVANTVKTGTPTGPAAPPQFLRKANLRKGFADEPCSGSGSVGGQCEAQKAMRFLATGKASEAKQHALAATRLMPESEVGWRYLGFALRGLGEHDAARTALNKALELGGPATVLTQVINGLDPETKDDARAKAANIAAKKETQ